MKLFDLDRAMFLYRDGNYSLFERTVEKSKSDIVETESRRFPDGESYVRIISDVTGADVAVFCSLDRPDPKFLPLVFTAQTLKEQGAYNIILIAPYLSYMRQDRQFNPGEAVTSQQFAHLICRYFDGLLTVDPHLHRYDSLDEVYTIPSRTLHADSALADWIGENVDDPLLFGPDSESEQWVSAIADRIGAPYNVLQKERHGDRDVRVQFDKSVDDADRTPVLIDDIISTAGTMSKATRLLIEEGFRAPICAGVHAIFAEDAFESLEKAGARRIVTCNTIEHESNEIDLSQTLAQALPIVSKTG